VKSFEYISVSTIDEACQALEAYRGSSAVIAGGTDLVVGLRGRSRRIEHVKVVIDITGIKDLAFISENDEQVSIGPLTTHAMLETSGVIKNNAPVLAKAASTVGSPQIRARGTVGGNIANASPAADTIPALLALDAKVRLKGPSEERVIPLFDVFQRPYKTVLSPNEVITEIFFPKAPETSGYSFIKLGRRKALSISRMNVAALIKKDKEGVMTDVRVAVGSVMPVPSRVGVVEDLLLNQKLTKDLAYEAGEAMAREMINRSGIRWSTEYKEPAIKALTRRAVTQAFSLE
jgi:CO/xanthine dehydrogenase FAD-binding subunit